MKGGFTSGGHGGEVTRQSVPSYCFKFFVYVLLCSCLLLLFLGGGGGGNLM